MVAHHLAVLAGPGRAVPGRIATILLPVDIEIVAITATKSQIAPGWFIQLTVHTAVHDRLQLLIARLNRLVEVQHVIELDRDAHLRQSVFVTLRPHAADRERVRELQVEFTAETLESDDHVLVLHLNASPERCEAFVAALAPYRVATVTVSGTSGVHARDQAVSGQPLHHRSASMTRLNGCSVKEKAQ
ncbi:MAG: hypothetical protein ABW137_06410 [Mycobacterium sp.]